MEQVRITDISVTKRGRYAIFVNDEFMFSIDEETLVRRKIKIDDLVEPSDIYELQSESDYRKAREKALTYLGIRAYAKEELYRKLCIKYDEETSQKAVLDMDRMGYLDDERFARTRVAELNRKGKSKKIIEMKLFQSGVSRDVTAKVLEDLPDDEGEKLDKVIEKSYKNKLRENDKDKVIAALLRRGFSYTDVKDAIEKYLPTE